MLSLWKNTMKMTNKVSIRNPLVWLRRIRHRKGYGVHSPFAYDMLTQVIYSPGKYYDYKVLDAQFQRWNRIFLHRRMVIDRLLFRLVNRWQPKRIYAPHASSRALNYLRRGCVHAEFSSTSSPSKADFIYLSSPADNIMDRVENDCLLVLDNLRSNKAFWEELLDNDRTRVTFDLYDVGIVIFDKRLQRQDFIINW